MLVIVFLDCKRKSGFPCNREECAHATSTDNNRPAYITKTQCNSQGKGQEAMWRTLFGPRCCFCMAADRGSLKEAWQMWLTHSMHPFLLHACNVLRSLTSLIYIFNVFLFRGWREESILSWTNRNHPWPNRTKPSKTILSLWEYRPWPDTKNNSLRKRTNPLLPWQPVQKIKRHAYKKNMVSKVLPSSFFCDLLLCTSSGIHVMLCASQCMQALFNF